MAVNLPDFCCSGQLGWCGESREHSNVRGKRPPLLPSFSGSVAQNHPCRNTPELGCDAPCFSTACFCVCTCISKRTKNSLHRSVQSVCFTQQDPWGSHFMTNVVVGVCSQPVVPIEEGDEGTGLLAGVHLNLLHTHTETPLFYAELPPTDACKFKTSYNARSCQKLKLL